MSTIPIDTKNRVAALSDTSLVQQQWIFWLYVPLLFVAEALVALRMPLYGLIAHGLIIVILAYQSALGRVAGGRRLALALLLVPLSRVMALTLPGGSLPGLMLLSVAGGSLLIATWLVVRTLRLTRAELKLTVGQLWMQLMIMGCGVALGYAGSALLHPAPLVAGAPWQLVAATALALLLFAGFGEELVFRGLLQTVSGPIFGRWGPLYVAIVFAIAQVGLGSPLYALLAFIAGLVFAVVVRLSGSILGVTLAHSLSSVTLLIVMPYVTQHPGSGAARALPAVMLVGGTVSLVALLILALAHLLRQPAPAQSTAVADLSRLRRMANLSYVELGLRTGIPARTIAEIELGLRPLTPDLAARLIEALDLHSQQMAS